MISASSLPCLPQNPPKSGGIFLSCSDPPSAPLTLNVNTHQCRCVSQLFTPLSLSVFDIRSFHCLFQFLSKPFHLKVKMSSLVWRNVTLHYKLVQYFLFQSFCNILSICIYRRVYKAPPRVSIPFRTHLEPSTDPVSLVGRQNSSCGHLVTQRVQEKYA